MQEPSVGINKEPIDGAEMTRFESAQEIDVVLKLDIDTVFLLTLVKGRVNLFTLTDEVNKQHYFIQKGIGRMEALIYRVVLIRDGIATSYSPLDISNDFSRGSAFNSVPNYRPVVFEDYKKQLVEATLDCPTIQPDINRTVYGTNLIKTVQKYNECVGTLAYVKPKDKAHKFFYGYAGTSKSFFSLKDSYNNEPTAFSAPIQPSFGIGFEWGIIRSVNRLSINIEANTINGSTLFSDDYQLLDDGIKNVEYDITLRGLRTNVLLKYVLYSGKLRPYVRGGIGKSFYTTAGYIRTETADWVSVARNLVKSEVYLLGSIGLKYKPLFLEGRYETGNDLNRTTGEDLKTRRLSVVVGYALSLSK